jgi:hypothetical protein
MTDTKIFKEIASTNLPELLYQQLEPHLDSLHSIVSKSEEHVGELEGLIRQNTYKHIDWLKDEFNKLVIPMWPIFARQCWPQIDGFYNLEEDRCLIYLKDSDYPVDPDMPC